MTSVIREHSAPMHLFRRIRQSLIKTHKPAPFRNKVAVKFHLIVGIDSAGRVCLKL